VRERYDVIVAGGGPAGLVLAERLAAGRLDVLVCERNARIGDPVRTSGGSWPADLRRLGLPDRLWHPITRMSFRSPRARATVDWGGPVGCALDVTATWRFLAERARRAGAEVRTGTLARWEQPGVIGLRGPDGPARVACRLAVDATGTPCALARPAGVHRGFRRVGVGYEEELLAPAFPQDEAMVFVGGVAPAGYAWAFPRGGTRVRAGVGVIQPDVAYNPRELYGPLARLLAAELRDAEQVEVHTGRIPSEEAPARLTGRGLLVVGDAGAHSNPFVGEGIRHVIRAAERAAPIAARALGASPGVVEAGRLAGWERAGRRERGPSWALAMRANRHLAHMTDERWDRAVEALGALPPGAVTALLRGELLSAPLLAGALSRGPAVAWRILRPFVRPRTGPAAAGAGR
jgi:digeranylgeranylglycerophospholipid reductase